MLLLSGTRLQLKLDNRRLEKHYLLWWVSGESFIATCWAPLVQSIVADHIHPFTTTILWWLAIPEDKMPRHKAQTISNCLLKYTNELHTIFKWTHKSYSSLGCVKQATKSAIWENSYHFTQTLNANITKPREMQICNKDKYY